MSTRCDKIVGYTYDITKEYNEIKKSNRDEFDNKWLSGEETVLNCGVTFKPYWNKKDKDNGKLMILYEGMNGSYCKLVFINEVEYDAFYEDDTNIVNAINKLLKTRASVPFEVKQVIREGYRQIFGKELERTSEIKPEYIVYWR